MRRSGEGVPNGVPSECLLDQMEALALVDAHWGLAVHGGLPIFVGPWFIHAEHNGPLARLR